jgi:hypothetical protein
MERKDSTISIALVEAYDHSEVLFALCQILDMPHIKLDIIAPVGMQKEWLANYRFQAAQANWHNVATKREIQRHLSRLNSCDLVCLITVGSPWKIWSRLHYPAPVLAIIHNSHHFFNPDQTSFSKSTSLSIQVLERLQWLKRKWRQEAYWQKKFRELPMIWGFPEQSIRSFVRSKGWISHDEQAVVVPFAFFTKKYPILNHQSQKEIKVVIPGTIKSNGRHYALVERSLRLVRGLLHQKVRLVLLGGARSNEEKKIVHRWQEMVSGRLLIQTFDHFIPLKVYDNSLLSADFLILPLKGHSRFGLSHEQMGKTTISGAINDVIRMGTPALVSAAYPLPDSLQPLTASYKDEHQLAALLVEWINHAAHRIYRQQADKALRTYDIRAVRQRFFKELAPLICCIKDESSNAFNSRN